MANGRLLLRKARGSPYHKWQLSGNSGDQNQFAIEMHAPLGARLLVGIALSAFAAFLLYYLLTGLYEYVLKATLEWLRAIPGFLVNLFMVLIFAVPAAVVFFKKVRVEVDQNSGKIHDVSDYRLYTRTKYYMLNVLDAVQIRYYLDSGYKTQYPYKVQFLFKDGKIVTAAVEENEDDAHRLAERLAQTLHVDLKKFKED